MTDTANPIRSSGDNLFGVCATIADDFGFNPLWLRVAFAATFLFSPKIVMGTYFALGAVALISRLLAPRRRSVTVPKAVVPVLVARDHADTPAPARLPLAA